MLPKIVYKYRTWSKENHQNLIRKNQLYIPSPKLFNDPFDCRIPTNYNLLDSSEKIKKFVDQSIIKHLEFLEADRRDINEETKKLGNRLKSHLPEFQKESEELLFKTQDINYGVFSLSMRWNSILLWSHYSDCHKGYCVGFNEEKLRTCGLFGKGGPVIYSNDFPEISPFEEDLMESSFKETHYKAADWIYENEYRLTKLFYPEDPTEADRTVYITDDFFEEINLGLNIDDVDKKEIIEIARQKKIKIYQIIKVPLKFQLDRIEC